MNRISLKVTGAQGQGVNSVGEMLARGLKDAGYCIFGYREYMSLIKGGIAVTSWISVMCILAAVNKW